MNGVKKIMPSENSLGKNNIGLPAAVIFDMDGTLVATTEADFLAWQRLFLEFGKQLSYQTYFPLLGKKSIDVVKEGLGLEGDQAQQAMHRKMAFFEDIVREQGITTLPNAERFLKEIKTGNIPIALATSSRKMKMQLVMEESGLGKYFSVFVTGEEVTHGKPSPDIFLLAAERLNVDPTHCIVIEDAVSGVAAAKAAGMKCIAITSTHDDVALIAADLVVDNYSELSMSSVNACFE
ncbi:MAG TPA: HAD family phosphatase [Chitinophagaceae bacterium]|nr:HAD family phosphatase [Chitinophagaceae bacterium]